MLIFFFNNFLFIKFIYEPKDWLINLNEKKQKRKMKY